MQLSTESKYKTPLARALDKHKAAGATITTNEYATSATYPDGHAVCFPNVRASMFLPMARSVRPAAIDDTPHAGSAFAERTTRPMIVEDASRRVREHAVKICDMCTEAKQPMKMSGFMARNLSLEQVAFELEYGTARPWSEIMREVERTA